LVGAGALGAGIALAVAFAAGGFPTTKTTVTHDVTVPSPTVTSGQVEPVRNGQLTIGEIYRRVAPGVVQITATSEVVTPADPFVNPFGPTVQTEEALGSGFVIDKAGDIVTNDHVVAGAKTVRVSFSNNESYKASVVGADPTTDLAVLRVNANARALTPLQLGDSDRVQVGDEVVAIGNPFGLSRTVTAGIVSALQRQILSPNQYTIDHVIQTDAAINHGNSGGPLIDLNGQVIGVNAQIDTGNSGQSGNVGIGFAIPSNTVQTVVGQILRTGHAQHPFLGIEPETITPVLSRILHLPLASGLIVAKVDPGTGAAKAGIKGGTSQVTVAGESYAVGGDVIARVDGARVSSLSALRDLVAAKKPGQSMTITLYRSRAANRGWKLMTVKVKLGQQPAS
jgi:S1-C subfamily serine protease